MKKIFATLLSVLILSNVLAENSSSDDLGKWYISPNGSYIKSDSNRLTEDNGYAAKLSIGKEVSNNLNLELGIGLNRFKRNSTSHLEQTGLGLDALYFFNRAADVAPYIVTGIGMYKTSETDDTNPVWGAGIGLMSNMEFLDDAKLRLEARFQQEFDSSSYKHDDVLLQAGVLIPFGQKLNAVPVQKDSDNDGILDTSDNCPNSVFGVEVDAFGCERDDDQDGVANSKDKCPNTISGAKTDAFGCELDSDKDGVKNSIDKCPNTLPGVAVNKFGCEVDSDKDGIVNSQDECPNTPAGVRVDIKGCQIKDKKIQLPGVEFELNSALLKPDSNEVLNSAAETLKLHSDLVIEVAGHTDSTGTDSYNNALSKSRAAAVALYLRNKGIGSERLTIKGYGESTPIADNNTKQGRALNRRVVLKILNQD